MSNDIRKYGERWDENDPALDLYDRWRSASISTKLKVANHLLSDSHSKGSNELARAVAVLLLREKDVPDEVMRLAWTSHKFILKDTAWLNTFDDPDKAAKLIRQEADQLKDVLMPSNFNVHASFNSDAFIEFISSAVSSLIVNDENVRNMHSVIQQVFKSKIGIKGINVQERTAKILKPLVSIAVKQVYDRVSSKEVEISSIFSSKDAYAVANNLAIELLSGM
jgi:hypothetical protein